MISFTVGSFQRTRPWQVYCQATLQRGILLAATIGTFRLRPDETLERALQGYTSALISSGGFGQIHPSIQLNFANLDSNRNSEETRVTDDQSAAVYAVRTLAARGELAAARAALSALHTEGLPEDDFQWIDLEIDAFEQPAHVVLAKANTFHFDDPDRRTRLNYTKAELLAVPNIGRHAEAISLLRTTLEEAPEYLVPSVATLLGWLLWRFGSPQDAIAALSPAPVKSQYEPGSYLALFLASLGRLNEAKSVLLPIDEELLAENPNFHQLLHRLIEFKERRSIEGALALAQAADVMKTYSAPALVEAADALLWAKRKDDAVLLLNEALQVDGQYDHAHMLLAGIALKGLRFREAISHIRAGRHWNHRRLLRTSR
jgi:predicted Zn-dependent protease